MSPVAIAVNWGKTEVVEFLFEKEEDLNVMDDKGRTALYWALLLYLYWALL